MITRRTLLKLLVAVPFIGIGANAHSQGRRIPDGLIPLWPQEYDTRIDRDTGLVNMYINGKWTGWRRLDG